jgi:putative membrane protein
LPVVTTSTQTSTGVIDWILRFVKGMFIGTGAILPGVSGGALAAVFGIYERIIEFLANLRKDFVANLVWFLPVAVGALFGVFALAFPLDYFLLHAKVQVMWFFIGCIGGTLPALFAEAGKRGRQPWHLALAGVIAVLALIGLLWARANLDVTLPQNFGTWLLAGAIFALGMIVPGLSPSNFLLYFNLYQPMTEGIKKLDFGVLIPVGIGAVLCVLAFAKAVSKLLEIAYPIVFHVIIGIVIASTAIIVPTLAEHAALDALGWVVTAALTAAGVALGLWMGRLESKYKPGDPA